MHGQEHPIDETGEDGGDEATQARADKWARRAAATVLIAGAFLVVMPALLHFGSVWDDPFKPSRTTETVSTTTPDGQTTTKETAREASRSFLERSLAAGGLVLFRIGLVALAAFLAGAVVQRTLLGNFALKLGPIEVPPAARRGAAVSAKALTDVKAELTAQAQATLEVTDLAASTAEELARLRQRLDAFLRMFASDEPTRNDINDVADDPIVDVDLEQDTDVDDG